MIAVLRREDQAQGTVAPHAIHDRDEQEERGDEEEPGPEDEAKSLRGAHLFVRSSPVSNEGRECLVSDLLK